MPPLDTPREAAGRRSAGRVATPAEGATNKLAAAHARFATAALWIYLGAAAIAVALLVAALVTDKAHEEDQIREGLLVETDLRAHSLGQHLGLLVQELRRLGLRSEVDLLDQNLAPEQSLLQLSHEKSAFFNVGVAIVDTRGGVVWAEPQNFLAAGTSLAGEPWFDKVRYERALRVVPVQPNREDALVYVVSPVVRNGEFTGALLGAIDLARGGPIEGEAGADTTIVLATGEGAVVYPAKPPAFSHEPGWRAIFGSPRYEPSVEIATLTGGAVIVAGAPVAGTDLVLLTVARESSAFHAPLSRLETRLALGLLLALVPFVAIVILLRRSLRVFRRSEEDAVREDRLRLLGEAASSIAHEVKNALNGLSIGLELVVRRDGRGDADERRERVVGELRREIHRLTDFTSELMSFSKGIEPRRVHLDLTEFLPKVTALLKDAGAENGIDVSLETPEGPVTTSADPGLVHVVVSNLVSNALDAAGLHSGPGVPAVIVRLTTEKSRAAIRVVDNGPGVSESMRPRLFEPFQTEKPNGVGIGLALSRKIARAHGGDLVLEQTAAGATMLFTLPLEDR